MQNSLLPEDITFSSTFECGCEHNLYSNGYGAAIFCNEHRPELLGERINLETAPDNTAQLREALEAILLAYKKLDSEISDSDLDDKQPKHICLNLGDIRNIQKLLRKKLPNEDFFATGMNMPELPKKLPWGLRPRQG